jgi:hypothetical protein
MVCGMCGGSLALLNAGVRGARLSLAVARGAGIAETARRVVCASTLELDDDLTMILGVPEPSHMSSERWYSQFRAVSKFRNYQTHPYY